MGKETIITNTLHFFESSCYTEKRKEEGETMADKKKAKQRTRRRRRTQLLLGVSYIITGVFLVYTLFSNAVSVYQQKRDIAELESQKEVLLKEKGKLEEEIELLNDEDYVTRYARENYVFTREGEHIAIIPSVEE